MPSTEVLGYCHASLPGLQNRRQGVQLRRLSSFVAADFAIFERDFLMGMCA